MIGTVNHVRIEMDEDFLADPEAPFQQRHEAVNGYGAIDDFAVHPLSLVLTLFGGIERVMCDMAKPYPTRTTPQGEREVEVYDIATILMRLANGASGFIAVSRTAWGRKGRIAIQIFGGKGSILFDQERLNEFQLYLTSDRPTEAGFPHGARRAAPHALRPLHSGAGPRARLQRPQGHRMPAADRPHPRRGHDWRSPSRTASGSSALSTPWRARSRKAAGST